MLQRWPMLGVSWQRVQGPELACATPGWSLASKGDNVMLPCADWQLSNTKSFRVASQIQGHMCKTSQATRCQKCWGDQICHHQLKTNTSFGILAFWGTTQAGILADVNRRRGGVVGRAVRLGSAASPYRDLKKIISPPCASFPAITEGKWPPLGENFPSFMGWQSSDKKQLKP